MYSTFLPSPFNCLLFTRDYASPDTCITLIQDDGLARRDDQGRLKAYLHDPPCRLNDGGDLFPAIACLRGHLEWSWSRFAYEVQDHPEGLAQAYLIAADFIGDESVAMILGDNIFEDALRPYADAFRAQRKGARIIGKEVSDPERFGVAEVAGDRVLSIEEKPKKPKSNIAVTGIYFYDAQVFDIIRACKPSARGELEITDVNNAYIRRGELRFDRMTGWWSDAGTFQSLAHVNSLVAQHPPKA